MTTGTSDRPEDALRARYREVLRLRRVESRLRGEPAVSIDDIIAEMRDNDRGTPLNPEFFEEIRRTSADASPLEGLLQPVIDDISSELNTELAADGRSLPCAVYAGQFPHGSFNAQARVVPEGVLVLLNSGLFMLLHQVLKVAALASRFTDEGANGELVEHPDIEPPSHTLDEIADLLTESVLAYLLFGESTRARRLPALGGVLAFSHGGLLRGVETFAVAHEFGHVLGGHLTTDEHRGDPDAFAKKSQHEEFDADLIGTELLVSALDRRVRAAVAEGDESAEVQRTLVGPGPLIFFSISQLVENVRSRVSALPTREPTDTSTHPSTDERRRRLREVLASDPRVSLELADAMEGFLAFHTDGVVARATAWLTAPEPPEPPSAPSDEHHERTGK